MVNLLPGPRQPRPRLSTAAGAREWFDNHPPIETIVSYTSDANSPTPNATAINITSAGDPQVQPRLRHARFGVFDPRRSFKTEFRRRILAELRQMGIDNFPIFSAGTHLRLTVTFNVVRMNKDIDNLLKLILDVLHSVVYTNDADVTTVVATKKHATNGDKDTFTELTVDKV